MLIPLIAALWTILTTSPPIRVDDSQLVLTEVMSLDGSPLDVHFSVIGSIEATDRGDFFVFDPVVQSLYLFDRDGEGAREIGRRGEGPGEFVRGNRMWMSGERLTVFDVGQSLLHSFTADGQFVAARRAPTVQGTVLSVAQELRGEYWLGVSTPRIRFNLVNGKMHAPGQVMVLPGDDGESRVLLEYRLVTTIFYDRIREVPWGLAHGQVFGDTGQWDVVGDSVVVVADGMSGVIEWYRVANNGYELVNRIETGFVGQPVPETDRQRLIALESEVKKDFISADTDWLFPTLAPGIRNMIVDSRGFVWLKRLSFSVDGPQTWRVIERQGDRWADVTLPAGVQVRDISDDRVFGVATDRLDIPIIKVFEFDRSQLLEVLK